MPRRPDPSDVCATPAADLAATTGPAARLERLRSVLADRRLDALVVGNLRNIRYLTGFSGSAGLLLVSREAAHLVVDFRYRQQAANEAVGVTVAEQQGPLPRFLGTLLGSLDLRRIGFETGSTWAAVRRLRLAARPARLVPAEGLVERLRMVKDPGETAVIERLVALLAEALAEFTAWLAPGVSEREAAWKLERCLRDRGSDAPPFPIIVAAGPNAALPHSQPGDRPIGPGEPVVVDVGSAGQGYATDITRTLFLGPPAPAVAELYRVVYDAHRAAVGAIGPGVRAAEIDRRARTVIRDAGWSECFGHATGHGVGLDVHESPSLSAESRDVLEPGMVVTVEPGVYREGLGGVRLENMVLVTADGCRVLTGMVPMPERPW